MTFVEIAALLIFLRYEVVGCKQPGWMPYAMVILLACGLVNVVRDMRDDRMSYALIEAVCVCAITYSLLVMVSN